MFLLKQLSGNSRKIKHTENMEDYILSLTEVWYVMMLLYEKFLVDDCVAGDVTCVYGRPIL